MSGNIFASEQFWNICFISGQNATAYLDGCVPASGGLAGQTI
jgi:hypothetical protein